MIDLRLLIRLIIVVLNIDTRLHRRRKSDVDVDGIRVGGVICVLQVIFAAFAKRFGGEIKKTAMRTANRRIWLVHFRFEKTEFIEAELQKPSSKLYSTLISVSIKLLNGELQCLISV